MKCTPRARTGASVSAVLPTATTPEMPPDLRKLAPEMRKPRGTGTLPKAPIGRAPGVGIPTVSL
jgi:hypothetical protein